MKQDKARSHLIGTLRRATKAAEKATKAFADPRSTLRRQDDAFQRFVALVTVAEMHKHRLDSFPQ